MNNQSQLINFRTDQSISPVPTENEPEVRTSKAVTRTMREYKITKLTSNKHLVNKQNDSIEKFEDVQKIMSSSSSENNLEQTPIKTKKKVSNTTTKKKTKVLKKYTNRSSVGKAVSKVPIPTIEQ